VSCESSSLCKFFIRAAILEKNSLFNRFGVIFKANKFGFLVKYVGKDCFFYLYVLLKNQSKKSVAGIDKEHEKNKR
jgi:hypothetical protein